MERIYHEEVYSPKSEESNERLLNLCKLLTKAQECFNEDEYKIFAQYFYSGIREKFSLPNKVFSIAKNEDETKAYILLFPKEVDGNHYKVYFDEESKRFCILADHTKD